jgi:hypothetical protein
MASGPQGCSRSASPPGCTHTSSRPASRLGLATARPAAARASASPRRARCRCRAPRRQPRCRRCPGSQPEGTWPGRLHASGRCLQSAGSGLNSAMQAGMQAGTLVEGRRGSSHVHTWIERDPVWQAGELAPQRRHEGVPLGPAAVRHDDLRLEAVVACAGDWQKTAWGPSCRRSCLPDLAAHRGLGVGQPPNPSCQACRTCIVGQPSRHRVCMVLDICVAPGPRHQDVGRDAAELRAHRLGKGRRARLGLALPHDGVVGGRAAGQVHRREEGTSTEVWLLDVSELGWRGSRQLANGGPESTLWWLHRYLPTGPPPYTTSRNPASTSGWKARLQALGSNSGVLATWDLASTRSHTRSVEQPSPQP